MKVLVAATEGKSSCPKLTGRGWLGVSRRRMSSCNSIWSGARWNIVLSFKMPAGTVAGKCSLWGWITWGCCVCLCGVQPL
eukprot:1196535-Pleurochrysis_carterae.AAC.1